MINTDIIYLRKKSEEDCIYTMGIVFKEFMNSLNQPLNLLLLKHCYSSNYYSHHTGFDIVLSEDVNDFNELLNENIYSYGDFCWVDFENEEDLSEISPEIIAQLLYFGHTKEPLYKATMLQGVNNRFAYAAHDDGWFNKVYSLNLENLAQIYSKVILNRLKQITSIEGSIENFMYYIEQGVLLDFKDLKIEKEEIALPLYITGYIEDFDHLDYKEIKATCKKLYISSSFGNPWVIEQRL